VLVALARVEAGADSKKGLRMPGSEFNSSAHYPTSPATVTAGLSPNDQANFAQVRSQLPQWLIDASPPMRAALRASLLASHAARDAIAPILEQLQDPVTFIKPLLKQAIEYNLLIDVNVELATLVYEERKEYFAGLVSIHDRTVERTLLHAALGNFDLAFTGADGFNPGSAIYPTGQSGHLKSSAQPRHFALMCRNLDFGRLYQEHLTSVLEAPPPTGAPPQDCPREKLIQRARTDFIATLHGARMKGEISEADYQLLLGVPAAPASAGHRPSCARLLFSNLEVTRVLIVELPLKDGVRPLLVYIPNDPLQPLKRHDSLRAFEYRLKQNLMMPDYRTFFCRFLPSTHLGELIEQTVTRLINASWARVATAAPFQPFELELLSLEKISGDAFEQLHQCHLTQIRRNARELIVPTADVDLEARNRRHQAYVNAGLNVAMIALSFVPILGEAFLVLAGAQLLSSVYHGFDAWAHGEKDQALGYLMEVAEQAALFGATAAAVKGTAFIGQLARVRLADGRARLWNTDLSPYRQSFSLPEHLQPDELGLYSHQDKRYLPLDEHLYEVTGDGQQTALQLKSRDRANAYSPALRHNSAGAWHHVHERPGDWSLLKLFRRLGHVTREIVEHDVGPILSICGLNKRWLQQFHLDLHRPSPLLLDTLKRFRLDRNLQQAAPATRWKPGDPLSNSERFQALYRAQEQVSGALCEQIRIDVPQLPKSYVQSLSNTIAGAEERLILEQKGLLSYLRDEATLCLETIKAARAQEGLYLSSTANPDSDLLALSSLELLHGWNNDVRLELREYSTIGRLLASVGADTAPTLRLLVRDRQLYKAYQADGRLLQGLTDMYEAIWQALPETQRTALNLGAHPSPRHLKRAIQGRLTRLADSPLSVRQVPRGSRSSASLDPEFAQTQALSGLTLRPDGLYQGPPAVMGGFTRHYILERGKYYQVEHSGPGWRLIDARNPYRMYKPWVREKTSGGWEIDTRIGLQGGGPGMSRQSLNRPSSTTSEAMLSASDHIAVEPFSSEELQRMRSTPSYQHATNARGSYNRSNNGRYPLRDLDGKPLRIESVESHGIALHSGIEYSKEKIMPYLKWHGYEKVARLYEDQLLLRPFTAADAKYPEEKVMIGQSAVFARRPLKKGDAIGIYGGAFIPTFVATAREDPYVIQILTDMPTPRPRWDRVLLSGDNILSRLNTIFEYEQGLPVRQAGAGYNIEGTVFEVQVKAPSGPNRRYDLTALFATEDIPADAELRWNYGYSEEIVRSLFKPATKSQRPA